MGTVGKSRAKTWKKTLREKSQRQNSLVQAEVLRTREVFFFFATYVENSAPVASLSGEYEELLSQNEGKELVLFDLHLLKWDQFCISAVHYNTVYVIDNLQNGLTYKECFAQLFHFWPLKENKMIQAGRRKFQQFLSCFNCNWKKKKKRFWKIKRVEYCCPVMIREFLCSREWKFLFVLPVVLIKNTVQTCL